MKPPAPDTEYRFLFGYSYHVGIDNSIYTLIFAMSRVAGWIAHIQEQRKNNKLIRPRSQLYRCSRFGVSSHRKEIKWQIV